MGGGGGGEGKRYKEEANESDKLALVRDTCNETKLDRAKLWLRNDTNNN